MLKSIRDIVHNYIHITPIEAAIIDSPMFQRLRHISQNSTASLTYPSNTLNRFSHSIGVMHLGGKMFIRALENADKEVVKGFLGSLEHLTRSRVYGGPGERIDTYAKKWNNKFGNSSGFKHDPLRKNNGNKNKDIFMPNESEIFLINYLWQAVRIGCLIHDIGHLPYSHVFEFGINAYQEMLEDGKTIDDDEFIKEIAKRYNHIHKEINDAYNLQLLGLKDKPDTSKDDSVIWNPNIQFHELLGSELILELMDEIFSNHSEWKDYAKPVINLGAVLFLVNRPEESNMSVPEELKFLQTLHTIISSEIDADRLDYCVRDPKSSAVEFGAIDVDRIIDSLILEKEGDDYTIAPSVKSISAIESFFHQRYLMYRYLIYHHNVCRMDTLVERITTELISHSVNPRIPWLTEILHHSGFWVKQAQKMERDSKDVTFQFLRMEDLPFLDDDWYRSLMMKIYQKIAEETSEDERAGSLEIGKLFLLLQTYLERKTCNLYSIWKRDYGYNTLLSEVRDEIASSGIQLEVADIHKMISIFGGGIDSSAVFHKKFIRPLRKELESEGVILLFKKTKAKIFDCKESLDFITENAKLEEVRGLSDEEQAIQLALAAHDSQMGERGDGEVKTKVKQVCIAIKRTGWQYNRMEESSLRVLCDNKLVAATQVSPYLHYLLPASRRNPDFHLSLLAKDIKNMDNEIRQRKYRGIVIRHMKNFVAECFSRTAASTKEKPSSGD